MDAYQIIGLAIIGAALVGLALDAWLPGLPEAPADPFARDDEGDDERSAP